jgi:release factor glutamine methyltransferase
VARMKAAGGLGGAGEGGREGFDLVVSNPPYIPASDYDGLAASVREWEDRRALIGEARPSPSDGAATDLAEPRAGAPDSQGSSEDNDGLIFYRKITSILDELLSADAGKSVEGHPSAPVVAFEVGQGQADAVQALLASRGYRAEAVDDQWGIQRLVLGYRG